jgi:exodeoxyribonuclease-3
MFRTMPLSVLDFESSLSRDEWPGRRGRADGARQAWRRIVHQGWTDALRALHPNEEKLYTFWDYTAGCWQRDLGFRLDHLLCSPEATDRLQDAGVDKWTRGEEKASDHAPTWVELS